MPVPDDKRQQAEQRIRVAAAALLAGDIPAGGRCDISTLARQAGVARATPYRGHPDPRDAQIARLKAGNAALKTRCAGQDQAITALQDQRALALSRLAAQYDEIQRLRAAAAAGAVGTGNVRALRAAPTAVTEGQRTALTGVKHPDHHATTADTTTSRGDR